MILTNNPDKCTQIGIFSNDISDHCAVGMIRNCKLKKAVPRIVEKMYFKLFDQQAFIHDIFHFDWKKVCLIPDVELAWSYFKDSFVGILNKHAPLRKFKVKGRNNPCFSDALSTLLHEWDLAWAKARKSARK